MVDLECPACGGPPAYAVPFGILIQCRCRDCGIDYSADRPEDDKEDSDS